MSGVSLTSPHPAASLRSLLLPAPGRLEVRDLLKSAQLELTYNGRGALFTAYLEIASTSSRRTVLLPSFHCPSAITPALMAGLKPIYYRIRPDLSVDEEHLWSKVTDDVAAVLIIDFFGTSTKLTSRRALQDRGIALVEDCSHSFYRSDDGSLRLAGHADSDYCVYSFGKSYRAESVAPSFVDRPALGNPEGPWRRGPPGCAPSKQNSSTPLNGPIAHS